MRRFAAALALVLLIAAPAEAQFRRHRRERPTARVVVPDGVYLGVAVTGLVTLHAENDADPVGNGAGLTLWAGYRLHEKLGVELGWLSASDADTLLSGVTADLRAYLSDKAFALGGLGIYGLDVADSLGTGFQLGLGAEYRVFTARALYRGIDLGGDTFISTVTVEAGLSFRF